MKNFVYAENIRLPTEKAHGVQIVNTCVELNKLFKEKGISFELVIAERDNPTPGSIWEYYDVKKEDQFKVTKFRTINFHIPERMFYWMQKLQFVVKLQWYLFTKYSYRAVVYSRDEFILFSLLGKIKSKFWESHSGKNSFFVEVLFKFLTGLIVITDAGRQKYSDLFKGEILVAHDAVDLSKFKLNSSITKAELREKFALPADKRIISYIGSVGLYDWKGVDVFLEAAKSTPEYIFLVVGGGETAVKNLKLKYNLSNIHFLGRRSHQDVPLLQKLSDVLVLPNKKGNEVSEKYTSPMKLFEYMASGVPIVSSDLQSLREILNEQNATFFEPNSPTSLRGSIEHVIQNKEEASRKAEQALKDVEEHTYEKRAKRIYDYVLKYSL